ncbi:MAG: (2Fe-2S)-binding protein [Gammaproteobacteria bacterium]|nr:(2Fe-2S)-binding protein [Gammaproteobacteria bacterium]
MYVCICNQVNERAIAAAVRSGARSLDCLVSTLEVATCCGKCADDACRVIETILAGEPAFDLATEVSAVA